MGRVMHSTSRPRTGQDEMIPKVLLRAMAAMVVAALAIVTYARVMDLPVAATPDASPILAERVVYLKTEDLSGSVTVRDAATGAELALTDEEGGFVAGVARVVARERTKHRAAPDGPVILTQSRSGRLAITDPSTGWSADLMGFGRDNAEAFARLLAGF